MILNLQGPKRKIIQAISYETVCIILVAPFVSMLFSKSLSTAAGLSATLSFLALLWNMAFNTVFEMWEAKQADRTRTLKRRILHTIGFEAGFGLMVIPLVAYWLDISWQAALAMNAGLLVFFMFYQLVFQWLFDKIFGLPNSALVKSH